MMSKPAQRIRVPPIYGHNKGNSGKSDRFSQNAGVTHFSKQAQLLKKSSSLSNNSKKATPVVLFPVLSHQQTSQTNSNKEASSIKTEEVKPLPEIKPKPEAKRDSNGGQSLHEPTIQDAIRRLSQSSIEPLNSGSNSPVPEEQGAKDDQENFDVMISYSHQDMDLMRYIREILKSKGMKVWVDEEGLGAGVDFLSKIGKAIVYSTCFLQILTEASVVSKYCKDELSLAYISNKPINIICSSQPDHLFSQMDFGQKLTLAPYKSKFVEITDLRLRKSQVEYMCDQIKTKIANLSSDMANDHISQEKTKNDMSAEAFWNLYLPSVEKCSWSEFLQLFLMHYGTDFEFTVPAKDQSWLLSIFKAELCDEKSEDPDFVTLEGLKMFCKPSSSQISHFVWESIQKYAREQLAIKGVFAIDSTVRLDAIENLSKFKSTAVQEALLDLLKDPDANVRSIAALSLAKVNLGYKGQGLSPTARVAKLLKDTDRLVRESACVALGRMKAEDQTNKLITVWRNDVISVVRDAAYLALELIGGDEATRAIYVTKVLSDEIKELTK